MYRLFFIIGVICLENANSYVLYQAGRQNDNTSGVAAQVAPYVNFEKQSINMTNEKTKKPIRRQFGERKFSKDTNSLESVVLSIDTGVKKFTSGNSQANNVIEYLGKTLLDFAKTKVDPTYYRSRGEEYNIKPEIIHFRSDKPSIMVELNSKSILNVLRDLLQSKTVNKYMDKFSKEAAVIYRSVKQELEQKY